MSEWLSYSARDLLMFTEETYRRLFENHNAALWPAQVAALLLGIALLILPWIRRGSAHRAVPAILAVVWLVVAGAWFWTRYSTVHTGGRIMAAAFALEAFALALFAIARSSAGNARPSGIRAALASCILAYGLLQPFAGLALGRPLAQAEVFGLTPDPTVIATLGALALCPRAPWLLWVIPVAWSLFSAMTLKGMHTPDWWMLPLLAGGSLVIAVIGRRKDGASGKRR